MLGAKQRRPAGGRGNNELGQLGDGTVEDRSSPVPVAGSGRVAEIALGWSHSCARRIDDAILCWGDNREGQLGDGTLVPRRTPSPVRFGGAPQERPRERLDEWIQRGQRAVKSQHALSNWLLEVETSGLTLRSSWWADLVGVFGFPPSDGAHVQAHASLSWAQMDDDEEAEAVVQLAFTRESKRGDGTEDQWLWLGFFDERHGAMKLVESKSFRLVHCPWAGAKLGANLISVVNERAIALVVTENNECKRSASDAVTRYQVRISSSGELTTTRVGRYAILRKGSHTLEEEFQLAERARDALAAHDARTALSILAEARARFPDGMLAEEREVLGVDALVSSGDMVAARAAARAYLTARPPDAGDHRSERRADPGADTVRPARCAT